jgi:hypothetical protein
MKLEIGKLCNESRAYKKKIINNYNLERMADDIEY